MQELMQRISNQSFTLKTPTRSRARQCTIGVISLTLLLGSCANMSDQQKYAIMGGIAGAAAGIMIGTVGGNAGLGAGVGVGSGLLGGFIYGMSHRNTTP
jgi:hypothetical protein